MVPRHILRSVFAAVLVLGLSIGAGAGAARADSAVLTKITARDAEALFRDLGYTGIETDRDGDLVVHMQGMKVLVLIGSASGTSMQMRFGITDTKADLNSVNTWNKTKMYSRAYLDDDGDPVLEAEQDLAGGVTRDRLKDFIKTFDISLMTFIKEAL